MLVNNVEQPDSRSSIGSTVLANDDFSDAAVSDTASGALCTALERLAEEIRFEERALGGTSRQRTFVLAFGIPLLSILLAMIGLRAEFLHTNLSISPAISARVFALILSVLAGCILVPIYYFLFHKRVSQVSDRLVKKEESYIALRFSTLAGRREYFREQLFRLSSKASRVFFGDEKRFAEASEWIAKAGSILDEAKSTVALSTVQSYLNSLSELVSREEREQKEERYWQYAAIAIMIIYVWTLVFAARVDFAATEPGYLFGVPTPVILWGAAGSLAAILYRFYTEQGRIRFATEFRWLIARPIIGIIMGGVVYIALKSGLVLLTTAGGTQTQNSSAIPDTNNAAFWIIAFLAGFSDKFYLGVIDLLVARTVSSREINSNTVVTAIERVPDASGNFENTETPKRGSETIQPEKPPTTSDLITSGA